jgi:hypothetical protein
MPSAIDDEVLTAIRLGCGLAEVRGRSRPDALPGSEGAIPDRSAHALPLRAERTSEQLRIAAQGLLVTLAAALDVDAPDLRTTTAAGKLPSPS